MKKKDLDLKEFSILLVRCIDCLNRKNCPKVRINKYARKGCEDYSEDLAREAQNNSRAAKF